MKNIKKGTDWLSNVVDSALGVIPVFGTASQNAFSAWRAKNINVAREVILSNIRQGDIEKVHEDELFSMLARLMRSIQEGVAKQNLVLLARLISGIGQREKQHANSGTFNDFANMLEVLTYEEIEFLAMCIKTNSIQDGNEELKQSLQFKGFFVAEPKSKVTVENTSGIILRKYDNISNMPNSARTAADITNDNKDNNKKTYDADIKMVYSFSKKFNILLNRYGDIWLDIGKYYI